MLTDQQVRHFRTFGFVALPGLFPSDEMSEIEREFEEVMEEERQGQAFHGEKRQAVMAFAELRPEADEPDRRRPHLRADGAATGA